MAQRYADLPASERVTFVYHRVRRGETLSEIGTRYGVSVSLLRSANNNIHPKRLRIGQRLLIPLSTSRSRTARAVRSNPASTPPSSGYHTVRRGESLWIISQRYGITLSQLRQWNGMGSTDNRLDVGQRLRVAPLESAGN